MKQLLESLPRGSENAIQVGDLCNLLNTSPRGLRAMIADARATGEEILYQPGGHGGYFLPSLDPKQAQQERLAFYRVQLARALCTLHALRPVAEHLGRPLGQLDFWEDVMTNESTEKTL